MLAPLACDSCGAKVPLAATPEASCPYCHTAVAIPPDYLSVQNLRAQANELRCSVESRWQAVTKPPWRGWQWLAAGATVTLPPAASLAAALFAPGAWSMADNTLLVALPTLVPGGSLLIWAIAAKGTTVRYQAALAAGPPERTGGSPTCRNCGAPLGIESGAVSATCGYCGTDSVVRCVLLAQARTRLRGRLQTLKETVEALRACRILLGIGAIVIGVPIVMMALLIWGGMRIVV